MSQVLRHISNFLQESRILFEALVAVVVVLLRLDQLIIKRMTTDRRRGWMRTHTDLHGRRTSAVKDRRVEMKPLRMAKGYVRRHVRGLGRRLARRALRKQ